MLPRIIKDAVANVDGIGYAGRCSIDAFPKLGRSMVEYQAGGMAGSLKIDMGHEAMELELTFHEHSELILARYGSNAHNGMLIRINASAEAENLTCEDSAIEILALGRISEIDMGGFKAKENTEMKVKMELSSYTYNVDGVPLIVIDIPNNIFMVKGIDMYAKRRKNLKI